jgi:hypothetical protein
MELNVFMVHGHVMDGMTVQTVLMKLIVVATMVVLLVQTVTSTV